MKTWMLATALLIGAEDLALACSCLPPPATEEQAQRSAEDIAAHAIAFAEVEVLSAYDERQGRGEMLRVRRVLAGRELPSTFRLERTQPRTSGLCTNDYALGPATVLLFPAREGSGTGNTPLFRDQDLCTTIYMRDPLFRAALINALNRKREAARPSGYGEPDGLASSVRGYLQKAAPQRDCPAVVTSARDQ